MNFFLERVYILTYSVKLVPDIVTICTTSHQRALYKDDVLDLGIQLIQQQISHDASERIYSRASGLLFELAAVFQTDWSSILRRNPGGAERLVLFVGYELALRDQRLNGAPWPLYFWCTRYRKIKKVLMLVKM